MRMSGVIMRKCLSMVIVMLATVLKAQGFFFAARPVIGAAGSARTATVSMSSLNEASASASSASATSANASKPSINAYEEYLAARKKTIKLAGNRAPKTSGEQVCPEPPACPEMPVCPEPPVCSERPPASRSASDADEIVAVAMVSAIASAAAAAEAASAAAATLSSVAAQASSVSWVSANPKKECKPFVASIAPAVPSAKPDDSTCCPPSVGAVGSEWAAPLDAPPPAARAVVSKPVASTRAPSAAEASNGLSLYEEYMAKRGMMIQMETKARKEAEEKARKLKEEQASHFFADLTSSTHGHSNSARAAVARGGAASYSLPVSSLPTMQIPHGNGGHSSSRIRASRGRVVRWLTPLMKFVSGKLLSKKEAFARTAPRRPAVAPAPTPTKSAAVEGVATPDLRRNVAYTINEKVAIFDDYMASREKATAAVVRPKKETPYTYAEYMAARARKEAALKRSTA